MSNKLELVRAGAGAGKTYDLCETVAQAVVDGLDPARILATTFTTKAAAELKGRVQAKLRTMDTSAASHFGASDRFELAAIGTVHSVAHHLLSRYAIEMGLSPHLEVMLEDANDDLLSALVGEAFSENPELLGESGKRLGIDEAHVLIRNLLSAKRGNRISDDQFRKHMQSSALRTCGILAPQGTSKDVCSSEDIVRLASKAIDDIQLLDDDTTKVTEKAITALRELASPKFAHWGRFVAAGKIHAGKSSGANDLLDPLRERAGPVRQHPLLHEDIQEYSNLLTEATLNLSQSYEDHKRARGLFDFTDLELLLLELLENELIAQQIAEDFELVLVDEFQDTNPLQLEIFQKLRGLSARSRWVGDSKQAIYGFRDTDPELINNVWNNTKGSAPDNLPFNRRSQQGLVDFVGELFKPLFGEDAVQQPKKKAEPQAVERWLLDSKNQTNDSLAIAGGVAELHAKGIRYGDIAIAERTNKSLGRLAEAFDTLGIPYLLESAGLLGSREVALVFAGYKLVADRTDSLAAATILHLLEDPKQDTPDWITERLESIQQRRTLEEKTGKREYPDPWAGDERFRNLDLIDKTVSSPTLVLQQVIEALGMAEHISRWGDAARRCANLDSLLRHSQEYEQDRLGRGQAATISGFPLHMEQLASDDEDLRFPPLGHDAVTLTTYHGAKGLEWPVVILSGLDSQWPPDMWSPVVAGGGQNPDQPLDGRVLQNWIWPFGATKSMHGSKKISGSHLQDDALDSDEGVERETRGALEGHRLLYVGCTRAKSKLVFAHRPGKYDWLATLSKIDELINTKEEGEHDIPGIDSTFVIRNLCPDLALEMSCEPEKKQRWVTSAAPKAEGKYLARFHSPSEAPEDETAADFDVVKLTGKSYFPSSVKEDQDSDVGSAVHGYLAAIPSLSAVDETGKSAIAQRCLTSFDVTGVLAPQDIVAAGDRFVEWVDANFEGATWLTEVPATAPRTAGGQWKGILDLVLQLPDGRAVIVDHKSAPIKLENCADYAGHYSEQLLAYREMIEATGTVVDSVWIHFPLTGAMAKQL